MSRLTPGPFTVNPQDPFSIAAALKVLQVDGHLSLQEQQVSADYTVQPEDDLIAVDTSGGVVAVTLPPPDQMPRKRYMVKRTVGGSNVTVSSSANIDGGSVTLAALYDSVDVMPGVSTWHVL